MLGGVARQVDGGHQEDLLRADPLEVQVGHALDLGVPEQGGEGLASDVGRHRLPREEVAVAVDEEDRDDPEEDAHEDRADGVPHRVAGQLVQQDAQRGEHDADERRAVLGDDGAQGGVGRAPDVAGRRQAAGPGLASRLPHGLQPGDALEDEGDGQHDVRQQVVGLGLLGGQGGDAVPDGDDRAGREQAERREHGPDVRLAAVAEGVRAVARAPRLALGQQQEDLVAGVRPRVCRLGDHRRGSGDDRHHRLGDRDQGVGAEGDEDGDQAVPTLVLGGGGVVGGAHGPSLPRGVRCSGDRSRAETGRRPRRPRPAGERGRSARGRAPRSRGPCRMTSAASRPSAAARPSPSR